MLRAGKSAVYAASRLSVYYSNSRQTVSDINKDWLIYKGFSDYKAL